MRAIFVAARAFLPLLLTLSLLSGCGAQEADVQAPTPAQARAELAGSPAALASLHAQAAKLLDGGLDAYRARLATLRGHPVVVNAWASWCGPCKYEMPYFSRAAVRFGRRVAFVGINAGDLSRDDARAFLREHFVPFPSYVDPHDQIAQEVGVRAGLPTTVFYGRDGKVAYVHQGRYRDEAALVADVTRYAGAS
ncbi:MAG TPA: TlpA disulfide reductase family protein [Conexibacter sp.]|nr:TlpA disulfide reductase family protein [Conexibacter sp.]